MEIKSAFITGASSGIGFALASKLIANNIETTITSSHEKTKPAKLLINENCIYQELDLKRLAQAPKEFEGFFRAKVFDVAVLNAGFGLFGNIEQNSFQQINDIITVNLTAQLMLLKMIVPVMKKNGGGKIILIGSENALKGGRYGSVYSASKAGLRAAAQSLRYEVSSKNIQICMINPGLVRTEFYDDLDFEPGDAITHAILPEDVAEMIMSVINMPLNAVVDEINMSPLINVVKKTRKS